MKIKGIEAVTPHGVKVECELEDVGDSKYKIMAVYALRTHELKAWRDLLGRLVTLEEVSNATGVNGRVRINRSAQQVMAMEGDYAVITSVRCMIEFTHERDARVAAYERGMT